MNVIDIRKLTAEQRKALDLLAALLVSLETGAGLQAPQNGPIVEIRHALGIRSVYNSEQTWRAALLSMLDSVEGEQTAPAKRAPSNAQLDIVFTVGQVLASGNDLAANLGGLNTTRVLGDSVRSMREHLSLPYDGHRPSSFEFATKLLELLDFADNAMSSGDKLIDKD